MTKIQKLFAAIFPGPMADAMKAESKAWKIRCCTCGAEKSVWDAGGIRYKARSTGKYTMIRCPKCGCLRRAEVYRAAK